VFLHQLCISDTVKTLYCTASRREKRDGQQWCKVTDIILLPVGTTKHQERIQSATSTRQSRPRLAERVVRNRKSHERGKRRRIERRSCVHHSLYILSLCALHDLVTNYKLIVNNTQQQKERCKKSPQKNKKETKRRLDLQQTIARSRCGRFGAFHRESNWDCGSHKWRLDWRWGAVATQWRPRKVKAFCCSCFQVSFFIVFVFPLLARRTKNGSSRLEELLSICESGPPKKRRVAEEVLHTQRHDATTVRDKKQASARLLVNEAALSAGCKWVPFLAGPPPFSFQDWSPAVESSRERERR
jgi:hypothetical protein